MYNFFFEDSASIFFCYEPHDETNTWWESPLPNIQPHGPHGPGKCIFFPTEIASSTNESGSVRLRLKTQLRQVLSQCQNVTLQTQCQNVMVRNFITLAIPRNASQFELIFPWASVGPKKRLNKDTPNSLLIFLE